MFIGLLLDLAEQLNLAMGWDDVMHMGLLADHEGEYGDSAHFVETAHRSIQLACVPD